MPHLKEVSTAKGAEVTNEPKGQPGDKKSGDMEPMSKKELRTPFIPTVLLTGNGIGSKAHII